MNRMAPPHHLLFRLLLYFAILIGGVILLAYSMPSAVRWLPVGGTDALEMAQQSVMIDANGLNFEPGESTSESNLDVDIRERIMVVVFLAISLALTVIVMVPITWTYKATRHDTGYPKNFVRALIILPLCATTTVLLIQDSLSLAFGLAALVAAVRFRVALQDPIDGIYIFAAICVALAAGIGYLGIATIMALFFCLAAAFLWQVDYGHNPLGEAREARERKKLEGRKGSDDSMPPP